MEGGWYIYELVALDQCAFHKIDFKRRSDMASDKCTKSGTSLWLIFNILFMGLLIVELGYFRDIWMANKELGTKIALIGTTTVAGTLAGLALMHQGLGNKLFEMSMRVALVTVGGIIAAAAILAGAMMGSALP
jgi:hypothetical protein